MTKRLLLIFDVLMLTLVLSAEGSRFFNFFFILSSSKISAVIFAVAVSLIIVYLALGGYEGMSIFSVIICICLSVISYIDPFVKEVLEIDSSRITEKEKEKQNPPEWKSIYETKEDKAIKIEAFKMKLEEIKKHNERIDKEILTLSVVSKTKMIAFLFSAFLMSFCVPLLTYLISHKLSKEFTGVIQQKSRNESIQNIFDKLGGNKLGNNRS